MASKSSKQQETSGQPEETRPEVANVESVKLQTDNQPSVAAAESPEDGEEISMNNIFTDDIQSVKYYLRKAQYINNYHNPDIPPFRHLRALLVKLKHAVPFCQFAYKNLFIEDIKVLQKMEHKYILDKTVSEKDRVKATEVMERLTELIQLILVNRAFIRYMLWRNKNHFKNLAKMLHINTGQINEGEILEEETNEECL